MLLSINLFEKHNYVEYMLKIFYKIKIYGRLNVHLIVIRFYIFQLLGITLRADIPFGLDLLDLFWKSLLDRDVDTNTDLSEADILTYKYLKDIEMVRKSLGVIYDNILILSIVSMSCSILLYFSKPSEWPW